MQIAGEKDIQTEYEMIEDRDNLEFIMDYFPEKDDIRQKGRLDSELPYLLSTFEQLPFIYPELAKYEELIYRFVDDIENRLISVDGESRKEYRDILASVVAYSAHRFSKDDGNGSYKDYFKSK